MITFKQFISEEEKPFDLDKFREDCAPYFKALGRTSPLLYRGTRTPPTDWEITEWFTRTGPRDSDVTAHHLLNKYFIKKFGDPIRNWQFATGDPDTARLYGRASRDPVTAIFPIGELEWVSCLDQDVMDLTGYVNRAYNEVTRADKDENLSYKECYTLATESCIKKMDKMKWEHNTDLLKCIDFGGEIMFKCDKFYSFLETGKTFKSDEFQKLIG